MQLLTLLIGTHEPGVGDANDDFNKPMIDFEADETATSTQAAAVDSRAPTPESEKAQPEKEEEDREHLTTFSSWGTPAARNKPGILTMVILLFCTLYTNAVLFFSSSCPSQAGYHQKPPSFLEHR